MNQNHAEEEVRKGSKFPLPDKPNRRPKSGVRLPSDPPNIFEGLAGSGEVLFFASTQDETHLTCRKKEAPPRAGAPPSRIDLARSYRPLTWISTRRFKGSATPSGVATAGSS